MPSGGWRRIRVYVCDDAVSAGRPAAGQRCRGSARGTLRWCRFPCYSTGSGCGATGRPGSLQHELPLAARAARRDRRTMTGEDSPRCCMRRSGGRSADLASGALACPSCGRAAATWGSAGAGHPGARRRPRGCGPRGRCRSCGATHILLPSWAVPRRADAVGVVARRLPRRRCTARAAPLSGAGRPGRDRARLARRLRARARQMLQEATSEFGRLVAVIETRRAAIPARRAGRVAAGRRAGPRHRVRARRDQVARPGGGRPGRADRPVRPRRRPRAAPEADPGAPSRASPCPHRPATLTRAPGDSHRAHRRQREHPGDTASITALPHAGMPVSTCSS